MRILITGAGEVGFLIASELYADHDVTVIDKDPDACARLQDMDVKVMQGNAANARLLSEADIKKADIVVAATGNDEVNVITCIIASHLGVRQTIARVSNPEYIDQPVQDRKEIGISFMICPELTMAEDMASSLYFSSMLMNRDLANGLVELVEIDLIHRRAEFQIIVAPDQQGKGIAAHATRMALDHGFRVLNLHKIYLYVDIENAKAIHIYTILGFRPEGELVDEFFSHGQYRSAIRMYLLQTPYLQRTA